MAQHFSSIFKPLSSSLAAKDENTHDPPHQRAALPLWLGSQLAQAGGGYHETIPNPTNISIQDHNLHNHHHLNPTINSLNTQNTPLMVPGSNHSPENNYQLNWVFGGKISSTSPNSSCQDLGVVTTNSATTTSLPSLYSTQHPQTSSSNSSHLMSATALLQKAAQIGATSTTNNNNDPFFLGNFGLIKGNNTTSSFEMNGNGDHQGHNNSKYSGNSLFGNNSNSTTTNLGSDLEGSSVDDLSSMTMYNPAAKRQKLLNDQQDSVGGGGGQTRDFLGVGSQPVGCHPPSINGWI